MEFYNTMLVNFQKSDVYSESPKDLAYKKGAEILERNKNFRGIKLEILVELICKEYKLLPTFFGYDKEKSIKIKDNHKTQDVKELLLKNSNIKMVGEKPIILKWLDFKNMAINLHKNFLGSLKIFFLMGRQIEVIILLLGHVC